MLRLVDVLFFFFFFYEFYYSKKINYYQTMEMQLCGRVMVKINVDFLE